jgi:ABC-type phosphate transport system substrate-binding protein
LNKIVSKKIIIAASCLMILLTLAVALPVAGAGQDIQCTGSTTVQPIAEASQTPYFTLTGNTILVAAGGSGAAPTALLADTCDVGNMSRDLKSSESPEQMIQWNIARDMVCMVVNVDLPVTDITKAEIQAMWQAGSGIATKTWNDVRAGWPSTLKVVPISRETTSGTRATFLELVPVTEDDPANDLDEMGTQAALEATYGSGVYGRQAGNPDVVALIVGNDATEQATYGRALIGYVGLGYALSNPDLRPLAVWNGTDWITPSDATFSAYPLKRYLHMVTRLPQYDPTYKLFALDYVYYILGSEGQALVQAEKFIPIIPGAEGNPPPYWDIVNTDGLKKCNIFDAIKVGLKWQQHLASKGEIPEDINGDAVVNIFDAVALGINWQKAWNW